MNILNTKQKTFDLIFLVVIDLFAVIVSFAIKANFLTSTFLFLGLPSIYLLLKETAHLKKILLASISSGLLLGFCFDFIAELNKSWSWNGGLVFGKILGVVQIDVMIWFFLWVLHIFLFYEHFVDKRKMRANFSPLGIKVFGVSILTVILLIIVYKLHPNILYFSKAYLVLCAVISIIFILIAHTKPKLVWHTFPIVIYFAFVYITHEVTALWLRQWSFPGDYVGMVHILGVSFPTEELIFWIILSSLMGAVFYELNFDNREN